MITPFKYYAFENLMENGAFAPKKKSSILHDIFKSIQNFTLIFFLSFFQCCLKIENDVMI